MRSFRTALPLLSLLALAGCQSGPDIAGEWSVVSPDTPPLPMKMEVTTTFTKPDKMETRVVLRGTPDMAAAGLGEGASITLVSTGTYSVSGGKLTTKSNEVTVTDEGVTGLAKTQVESQREALKSQLKQGDVTEAEMVWEGDDSFTVKTAEGTATFTRK